MHPFYDLSLMHPDWRVLQPLLPPNVNPSQTTPSFPPPNLVFSALAMPLAAVRVVILGQDPYHGPGQAHGLAFSVPFGTKPPPSLQNILKEIRQEFDVPESTVLSPNLGSWAKQGVLLLNTVLTVGAHLPQSHEQVGWQTFTRAVLFKIAKEQPGVVFFLWGKSAQVLENEILKANPMASILKSSHPSPLSAYRGFLGCGHFKKCNTLLQQHGSLPIDWVSHALKEA